MTTVVQINESGTLTLPEALLKKVGLSGGGQVVVVSTPDGLLLYPEKESVVEDYSAERIAEFQQSDEKLSPFSARIEDALRSGRKVE